MAKQVLAAVVSEVKVAEYYSLSVDSTPDFTRIHQLTFILRYIGGDGTPVERFVKFIAIERHDAENLTNIVIISTSNDLEIPISNCRRQCYDNASNMAGKYSGVQQRTKYINPFTHFVPCSTHSLNLVGSFAAESCVSAVSFFGFIQALDNFFSSSTNRWKLLTHSLRGAVA
jgi:hypothetical protein